MDDNRWDIFSPGLSLAPEINDVGSNAVGSETMLQDPFENEIISKRFEEGGRLMIRDDESGSPGSPEAFTGKIAVL
eukprot:gene18589-20455_t